MKLVVMIPAYNEEESIAGVIKEIPREIDGADSVEILVINDGSTDRTVEVAREAGADHIISFSKNRGLANAFKAGLEGALERGADIIVNTDADGQYNGAEIPKLIGPILDGEADAVLGSRFKGSIEYMPIQKKVGNRMATLFTRRVSGFPVSDAQTGFRAFTREAALRINILSSYTYTQETIIQLVENNFKIVEVPIEFRKREGKSRLISGIFNYAKRAGVTILRTYLYHRPLRVFTYIGGALFLFGSIFAGRVLIHYFQTGLVSPYLPSAVLATLSIILGFLVITMGLIAELMGVNRRLQEEILYRMKREGK